MGIGLLPPPPPKKKKKKKIGGVGAVRALYLNELTKKLQQQKKNKGFSLPSQTIQKSPQISKISNWLQIIDWTNLWEKNF